MKEDQDCTGKAGEGFSVIRPTGSPSLLPKYKDKEWLYREYVVNKRSMDDIAKECGCSVALIIRYLRRFGIQSRSVKEACNLPEARRKNSERNKREKSLEFKGYLQNEYIENKRSSPDIAREYGCSSSTITFWLKRYGLPIRTHEEIGKLKRGEKHWAFGKHTSEESNKKRSISMKKMIDENPGYMEKLMVASQKGYEAFSGKNGYYNKREMNEAERKLLDIINQTVPGKYKFNPWIVFVGRKVPDFIRIAGDNKCIDLFGEMWHTNKDEEQERIAYLAKCGWKCLIIWGSELRNIDKVKTKILKFDNEN